MTMGARIVGPELAKTLVRIWLDSEFAGGASARKVAKITAGETVEPKTETKVKTPG